MTADPWLAAAAHLRGYGDDAHDPVGWIERKLSEFVWSQQREIIESVRDNRYTAVQSCHDAGKSYIASRAVAWWIDSHPVGSAFVVSTAPTSAQVSAILWREIGKARRVGDLPGRVLTSGYPQWKIGEELVGYGRKPADYADSAFQGIHALYVLVVLDEACGIPRSLWDAVDALATNQNARVLAIGNPDDPGSHFRTVCQPKSGWNTFRIDGLRTPNMTAEQITATVCPICEGPPRLLIQLMREEGITPTSEQVPAALRDYLISPLWVEERLHRWVGDPGADEFDLPKAISQNAAVSPLFTAKVRGLFPDDASQGVIPLGWIERAIDRWNEWVTQGRPTNLGRRVVGVDVAREGNDETVLATRVGWCTETLDRYQGIDTMATANLTTAKLDAAPHAISVVDVIGIGAGVVDRLREQRRNVVAFNASADSGRTDHTDEFRFRNDRSAAWWRMRELLDPSRPGGSPVMLPDDEQLKADLVTPRWKVLAGKDHAVIAVEPKEEIRKRLGRSTDTGDAVIQSYWVDGSPVGGGLAGGSGVVHWFSSEPGAPEPSPFGSSPRGPDGIGSRPARPFTGGARPETGAVAWEIEDWV